MAFLRLTVLNVIGGLFETQSAVLRLTCCCHFLAAFTRVSPLADQGLFPSHSQKHTYELQ